LEAPFERARLRDLRELGFLIERVIATGSTGAAISPKTEALQTIQPVAFVDDFLPYFRGLPGGINKALVNTQQPASVDQMLANAEDLAYNHRRTLARNVSKVEQAPRPVASCAHHIVALADKEARRSRQRLFGWGIGINDAGNGVFLPRDGVGLPNYPNAAHHRPYHRVRYHLQVWMRLQRANDEPGGRTQLRGMKADLLAGKMAL